MSDFITLSDLYKAYRKAKAEAFFEATHFGVIAFANYEQSLDANLKRLLKKLSAEKPQWHASPTFLGGYSYLPKSVAPAKNDGGLTVHFRTVNPEDDWIRMFERGGKQRLPASFRLVAVPSVDFQVVSALWILKVGYLFDASLSSKHSFGNRLKRVGPNVNEESPALFEYYFFAYRKWREEGLKAMRDSLRGGKRIAAVTMDIKRFYHSVSPTFLLQDDFLKAVGVELTREQRSFTELLIQAINNWYRKTPDFSDRPEGAIPVGLSASKIIANVLLSEFDRKMSEQLAPIYYGRYVDDIFLVVDAGIPLRSGEHLMQWIQSRIPDWLSYETPEGKAPMLRLRLPYATDSDLIFAGDKQKIFLLAGPYGLDLVGQIGEQIRQKSSEHRLLAELPVHEHEMAERALLATPDATLEADALRKADSVSLKRLGFSLLLRTVECYARDLKPSEWRSLREHFYALVQRYVITPAGLFDYFGYIQRVFGLMVASGDLSAASQLITGFERTVSVLRDTTSAGTENAPEFARCIRHYARGFFQTAIQASTAARFGYSTRYFNVIRRLYALDSTLPVPPSLKRARQLGLKVLLADLGRRAYRDYWYHENPRATSSPAVPDSFYVRRRLILIKRFRERAELHPPHWPALVFPTRPLTVPEISLVCPAMLSDVAMFKEALYGLRGARVRSSAHLGFYDEQGAPPMFVVPTRTKSKITVAVTSIETTDAQAVNALLGIPDHSLRRYTRVRRLINRVLLESHRADYVALPEASIPLRWAIGISQSLAKNRVSMLAGVEHRVVKGVVRNDALVSLATRWPGYYSNVSWLQAKLKPAYEEAKLIRKHAKRKLLLPDDVDRHRPVYVHGGLCFGVVLCSDLTTIDNRRHYQGAVDALFVLEWNQDVKTFSFLIESAAHDVHAYIIQINNRRYGDSRVRAPFEEEHKRDLIRVKGGISDYYVMGELDIEELRKYQRRRRPPSKGIFKPYPIGFKMSRLRKAGI